MRSIVATGEPVKAKHAPPAVKAKHVPPAKASVTSLGEWAMREKPKRAPRSGIASSSMDKAIAEVERRREEEDWKNVKPLVFVALYAQAHEFVYDIAPTALGPKERKFAACAAARMLRTDFDDDSEAMAEFIRWTWDREMKREKWRRENKSPSNFRITWRLMFSGTLLDDWRVARLRGQA